MDPSKTQFTTNARQSTNTQDVGYYAYCGSNLSTSLSLRLPSIYCSCRASTIQIHYSGYPLVAVPTIKRRQTASAWFSWASVCCAWGTKSYSPSGSEESTRVFICMRCNSKQVKDSTKEQSTRDRRPLGVGTEKNSGSGLEVGSD